MLALLGGPELEGLLEDREAVTLETPYGRPAAPVVFGTLGGVPVATLSRRGPQGALAPHCVPYRANLWALKKTGAAGVIALGKAGGIARGLRVGTLAVPDQLIDYTKRRDDTFFDDFSLEGAVHADMTEPFDSALRNRLLTAVRGLGALCMVKGTYACTEGPRYETAAEVRRYERDGADLIGMTFYPECALARELGLPYAGICLCTNRAAGLPQAGNAGTDLEAGKTRLIQVITEVVRAHR